MSYNIGDDTQFSAQGMVLMRVGVDFDNTIICYDMVFHRAAIERGLIPPSMEASKVKIRDYLRKEGKEREWTEMQGYVYGPGISDSKPFAGVFDFFRFCRERGISVWIVSHKTRYPYLGQKYDLHQSAYGWLEQNRFFDPKHIGLKKEQIFFELTVGEKIGRIKELRCTHFIDDLPEFFLEPSFPKDVTCTVFDPNGTHLRVRSFERASSWWQILELFKDRLGQAGSQKEPRVSGKHTFQRK